MEKLKRNKLSRPQEREIFQKGVVRRIAQFMDITGFEYLHRQPGKRTRQPHWNESTAKRELVTVAHGKNQIAELLKDLQGSYLKGQPCIDKLLLVCFCLRVSPRRTSAVIAPLLSKRVSARNIVQVATNLNRELAGYHRSRPHKLSSLLYSAKRRQTTGTITLNRELKNPYPTTMSELEEELDLLLTSLRSVESDLWNRLETAGLIKGLL